MKYMSLRAVTRTAVVAVLILGHSFGTINAAEIEQKAHVILEACLFDTANTNDLSYFIDQLTELMTKHHDEFIDALKQRSMHNPDHYLKRMIEDLKSIRHSKNLKHIGATLHQYKWLLPNSLQVLQPTKVVGYLIKRLKVY